MTTGFFCLGYKTLSHSYKVENVRRHLRRKTLIGQSFVKSVRRFFLKTKPNCQHFVHSKQKMGRIFKTEIFKIHILISHIWIRLCWLQPTFYSALRAPRLKLLLRNLGGHRDTQKKWAYRNSVSLGKSLRCSGTLKI